MIDKFPPLLWDFCQWDMLRNIIINIIIKIIHFVSSNGYVYCVYIYVWGHSRITYILISLQLHPKQMYSIAYLFVGREAKYAVLPIIEIKSKGHNCNI